MTCMGADSVLPDWKIKSAGKGEYRVGQMSMTIGIFIKLVRALDTDADRLLGIVPAGEADRKYRDILYQINHLKTH